VARRLSDGPCTAREREYDRGVASGVEAPSFSLRADRVGELALPGGGAGKRLSAIVAR
jgi:hypothetical protein